MIGNKYAITIEYDGTNYYGFQEQHNPVVPTVESALNIAIKNLHHSNSALVASGRTDAGVHALGQVAHFESAKKFSEHQVVAGLNFYLRKEDIKIISCQLVDDSFHARFSAVKRSYQYLICNRKAPLTLFKNRAWHIAKKLDVDAMKVAANFLVGEHDFSSFRDAECQAKSPVRTIDSIDIANQDEFIKIVIVAKSFLHHMVRNIVGTLTMVGLKKMLASDLPQILLAKNRTKSGPNAPACGLYFLSVKY